MEVDGVNDTEVFHNLALFDGVLARAQPNSWLEVADGHIHRIGFGSPPPHEGKEGIDLGGQTVIPGLIDAHVHLMIPFIPEMTPFVLLTLNPQMRLNLANCIRSGVTTVRDVGCAPGMIRRMKGWIETGKAIGPRIICTNSMIIPPGGMPEVVHRLPFPLSFLVGGQFAERVDTPEQVRGVVGRMVEQGADWIKTTHTDKVVWMDRPDPPVFDDACFTALVDEAHRQNRPVVMHQTWASGFRKALDLRVDSMEHAPLDELTEEDIGRMVEAGIPIVPTMRVPGDFVVLDRVATWMDAEGERYLRPRALRETRSLLQAYQDGITPEMAQTGYHPDMSMLERQIPVAIRNISRLHAAGAVIGCGTDSGGDPFAVFGRICDEIDYLLEAGLSAFEVLRSATAVNARILGLDDRLGTIEAGKLADFVVLDGDPLADITALRRVRMVVKEGKTLYREEPVA